MQTRQVRITVLAAALVVGSAAMAADDPRIVRHELMEGVRNAARPVGQMMQGERDFDAAVVMESLAVFKEAAATMGDMFPPGTETGEDTRATAAVWDDRASFDAAIAKWQEAIDGAIAANPGSLEELRPAARPVFQSCRGCHDTYRTPDE